MLERPLSLCITSWTRILCNYLVVCFDFIDVMFSPGGISFACNRRIRLGFLSYTIQSKKHFFFLFFFFPSCFSFSFFFPSFFSFFFFSFFFFFFFFFLVSMEKV